MPVVTRLGHRQERRGQSLCAPSSHYILQHDTRPAAGLRGEVGIQKREVEQVGCMSSSWGAVFPGKIGVISTSDGKEEAERP